MKFLVAIVLFACIAISHAKVVPVYHPISGNGVIEKCDYQCPKLDVPVCAKNGQCTQLFASQCAMSAYNCRHPQKPFQQIEDYRCEQGGAPLCNLDDKRELGL